MIKPFSPTDTWMDAGPDGALTPHALTPDFFPRLQSGALQISGYLVSRFSMEGTWPHWEMHPEGDELIYLLSGRGILTTDDGTQVQTVELAAGQAVRMPAGVWHHMTLLEPAEGLFLTWGAGTEHRPWTLPELA